MTDINLDDIIAQDSAALDADLEKSESQLVENADLPFLVQRLEDLRDRKSELEADLKGINGALKELEEVLLPDTMRALKIVQGNRGSFTTASGKRVSLRTDIYASTNKAKEQEFFEWLRDHDAGDLIKETVNAQTLRAFVREQREQGVTIPDDLVNTYEVTKAVLTKK